MTRDDFKKLKSLMQEAEKLQEELQNLPFVPATVKGSMPEFPYIERTIKILGVDENIGKQVQEKLDGVLWEIQRKILLMEQCLEKEPDPETRMILRLKYRNGLTDEQIAEELGCSERTIRRKVKAFFSNVLECPV